MTTLPAAPVSLDKVHSTASRKLYVVFSSTPYRLGSFIRVMTRNEFNHVAISLESDLSELYSFARHYRNTPFYGGFVKETIARYRNRDRIARIKVCAIDLTEEQYARAKAHLSEMYRHSDEYLYNMLSAIILPLHRSIRLPNAYTCVEFVTYFLRLIGVSPKTDPARTYSIRNLEQLLDPATVYCGEFPHADSPRLADPFDRKQTVLAATLLTVTANARLLSMLLRNKIL